ncbi:MAG: PAS domain S-box protein [Geobacteraceae bacterium]|nr:PAS domain S-box protein [Geobacteraceae bacterium]
MKSLTSKMTLTVSLVVAVLLSLIIAISHTFWSSELQKSISNNQNAMVDALARQLDTQLATAQAQLLKMAQRITEEDIGNVQRLNGKFADEEDALVFFNAGLELLAPDGRIITEFPLDPKDSGKDVSNLAHFIRASSTLKPFIGGTYRNHNDKQPTIPFVVPLLNKQGKLSALLVGRHEILKGSTFSSLISTRIGRSGYFYIIDTDRNIVVHADHARIMGNVSQGVNPAVDSALSGFEGTRENINSRGVPGLTSFKRLNSASWILGVHTPTSEAYQPLYKSLKISLTLLAMALLSSILITRGAMARMLSPLNRLTTIIQEFEPGQDRSDLQRLAESDDEVGRLGLVYDRMIVRMEEQHSALRKNSLFTENLVNYSATPCFVIDSDHHILFWNQALAKLSGLASEEMRGSDRHWQPFYPEKRPTLADLVLDSAEQEFSQHYETYRKSNLVEGAMQSEGWFSFPASGRRFLYFHASPIRDDDGRIIAVMETLEDLTETRQIGDMLNEQYRFLQQVLDSIPNPVFYKNRNSAYIGCNRAFEEFFGRSRTEIMGKKINDLNQGETAAFQSEQDSICMRSASTQTYETSLLRSDGSIRQVISTKAPMYNRNGKVNGLVGTFTDITERKLTEIALRESEEKFRSISDSAQDAIIMIDNDGLVTFWNAAAETIFGYTKEEILGRNLHEQIAPADMLETHLRAFAGFRENGQGAAVGKTLELPAIRKGGEAIPIEMSLSAVRLEGKWCAIGLARDITARREAHQALAASQAALEAKHAELGLIFNWVEAAKLEWEQTLDSLKDIIILADATHHIRRCNRMLNQITGRNFDNLVLNDWREVLMESGFNFVTFDGESGELIHSGTKQQFDLNIYEIRDPGSSVVKGVVVSMNDVTQIKTMTCELEQAYSELQSTQTRVVQQEKMASIGQMAAGVAHEINNPMGFITSNLNTLGKYMGRLREYQEALKIHLAGCESDSKAALLEIQRRLKIDYILEDTGSLVAESLEGAERVRKIVQDLKSFSRVDDADETFADLNQCLESTINIVWNEIKYVATLTKELGDIPRIKCYPQQLNQVFMNLLVNAAHAISGQGVITVRSWNDADNVFVSIGDTGSGIPEELQRRIFEPFFTTKEAGKGTGLGLSISSEIIRKHGGEILLESKPGQGTTFTVRLPLNNSEG